MPSTVRRLTAALAVMVIVTAACGDDDATTTTAATTTAATTSATTAPPATTELRFTFEGITAAQDKILVGTIFESNGPLVGTVCLPVTSDPFSGSAVVATSAPDNPCGHDAPYGVPLSTNGTYGYLVAVYLPGTQTATACAAGEVTIAQPTEVIIADADLTAANCADLG